MIVREIKVRSLPLLLIARYKYIFANISFLQNQTLAHRLHLVNRISMLVNQELLWIVTNGILELLFFSTEAILIIKSRVKVFYTKGVFFCQVFKKANGFYFFLRALCKYTTALILLDRVFENWIHCVINVVEISLTNKTLGVFYISMWLYWSAVFSIVLLPFVVRRTKNKENRSLTEKGPRTLKHS